MSTEQNKALIHRLIEELFNQGILAVADEIIAPDFNFRDTPTPGAPGPQTVKQTVIAWRTGFPDVSSTIDDLIAEGDKTVHRWTIRGTHHGEFLGVAATGKAITVTGIGILRIANGKIVEGWQNYDKLGLQQQLGLIPSDKAKEGQGTDTISTEQNKAVIRQLFAELWSQHNVAVIDELFAPDFVAHRAGRPVMQGSAGLKPMVEGMTRTFGDDSHSTIDALIAEDDLVVARWTLRGTHTGEWRGIAATGKPITITGITIHRLADGKIVELWAEEDWLELMQQIGGLPGQG